MINGQVTVTGFPPSSDEVYVRSVRYLTSKFDSGFRLDVGALVTVLSIDAATGLDPSEPCGVDPAASA